jgi:hypothetical protein
VATARSNVGSAVGEGGFVGRLLGGAEPEAGRRVGASFAAVARGRFVVIKIPKATAE